MIYPKNMKLYNRQQQQQSYRMDLIVNVLLLNFKSNEINLFFSSRTLVLVPSKISYRKLVARDVRLKHKIALKRRRLEGVGIKKTFD